MRCRCDGTRGNAHWFLNAWLFLLFTIGLGPFIAAPATANNLDRWRVAGIIASVSQETGRSIPGVHIHIVDPSDYVSGKDQAGVPNVDTSALVKRISGELTAPLDVVRAMRVGREAAFALYNDEMATALHALPDHKKLCLIFPRAAPLQLSKLASDLSGTDESVQLGKVSFKAADFYRFLLYHEVAHCAEDAWYSDAYDAYRAECRADAFATLMYVHRTGDMELPRFIAGLRQSGKRHRADYAHQTSDVVGPSLKFAKNLHLTKMLEDRTIAELLFAARILVQIHAVDREEFQREVAAASEMPQ